MTFEQCKSFRDKRLCWAFSSHEKLQYLKMYVKSKIYSIPQGPLIWVLSYRSWSFSGHICWSVSLHWIFDNHKPFLIFPSLIPDIRQLHCPVWSVQRVINDLNPVCICSHNVQKCMNPLHWLHSSVMQITTKEFLCCGISFTFTYREKFP